MVMIGPDDPVILVNERMNKQATNGRILIAPMRVIPTAHLRNKTPLYN